MTDYGLTCEFDVVRRVGWSDDELAVHVDDVFERLRQSAEVTSIEASADLDTGRVTMDVEFSSWEVNRTDHAKTVISVALRAAGARHDGLFSLAEESKLMGSKTEAWSALRGATWKVRRTELTTHE